MYVDESPLDAGMLRGAELGAESAICFWSSRQRAKKEGTRKEATLCEGETKG